MLGIGPDDDLAGLKILDLHPEDLEQFARTVALPHAVKHGSWSGETSIIRTDGTVVPVWQVLMSVEEETSGESILVTFVRDLRDLRTLQNQVDLAQEARARAEAAELAKSRFLANMSHEIYISVSIGACVAPEDGDLIDSLIRQAEIAMYQAKSQMPPPILR